MKWWQYAICFVLIVVGVFCGIRLVKEVTAESYINGSINIENKFSQESFNYSATSLVFYSDTYNEYGAGDIYYFDQDLLKVDDFNGQEKIYQVKLNDFVLISVEINAGSVFANVDMDFYDTDGVLVESASMKISIKFLSNKTQLTIITTGQGSASFLSQYFADNGIRLRVIEIKQGVEK